MTPTSASCPSLARSRGGALLCVLVPLLAILGGCSLKAPQALETPYGRRAVWAVVPPSNESGTSAVDRYMLGDRLVEEAAQIVGVDIVPLDRSLAGMQALGLESVTTPAQAAALQKLLDVDGVLVSTITAYDPYPPLVLGLSLELVGDDPVTAVERSDPRDLAMSVGEQASDVGDGARPLVSASAIYDANDHRTLIDLRDYAAGRTSPDSAYGENEYLTVIDRYARFAFHRTLRTLLARERARVEFASAGTSGSR